MYYKLLKLNIIIISNLDYWPLNNNFWIIYNLIDYIYMIWNISLKKLWKSKYLIILRKYQRINLTFF